MVTSTKLLKPAIEVCQQDEAVILRCARQLGSYPNRIGDHLYHWAENTPERDFLAERRNDPGWRTVNYPDALAGVEAIAQALIDRGLSPERPVMILSGNSINFALLSLAAMHAGIPYVPVSPAYSLLSSDFAKLKYIAGLVQPGLIYVEDYGPFHKALASIPDTGAEIVCVGASVKGTTPFSELRATRPSASVRTAFTAVTPDTVAKILFTSGSTGGPKGVINTQRMLCSNQQTQLQLWPFLREEPPVIVDWLPWHHTFGGNFVFGLVLSNGGTLYIDAGRPLPGRFEQSLANLQEVAPTIYLNVPAGFDMLAHHLEQDQPFRAHFFSRQRLLFYAAASLPQSLWGRLDKLAKQTRSEPVPLLSAWGATETGPLATETYEPSSRAGLIGLPVPGVELKLVPAGDKKEIRVRGPNVTPGYWKRPELNADAFDAENYWRTGDAVKFADPEDPSQGLLFDGRISEEFKLMTGTWVHTETIRLAIIECCNKLVQNAVVTGQDREAVGLLLLLNTAACRRIAPELPADAGLAEASCHPAVRDYIHGQICAYNRDHPAGSTRIARALLLTEPLSLDAGEITDKGSVNQRGVLARRSALVEGLYNGTTEFLDFN